MIIMLLVIVYQYKHDVIMTGEYFLFILLIFKYNVNLHYQQNIYTPNINLTKFEPLKPSRSGDISLLVFKNTHTSCVYFDINFSGLSPRYPNVTLRS